MKNVWGHFDALLEGPCETAMKRTQFQQDYADYYAMYHDFLALARGFPREQIPVLEARTTGDEWIVPQGRLSRDEAIAKWTAIVAVMDAVASCNYVHSVSKLTQIQQSYMTYDGHLVQDAIVTDEPYRSGRTGKPSMVKNLATQEQYKDKLMRVILQE
jgi:hypothetical protein